MNHNTRAILPFPDSKALWNRIHDRLHTVVERYIYQSRRDSKFTLIINAIPREVGVVIERDNKGVPTYYSYVSTEEQRRLLEPIPVASLNSHWDALKDKLLKNISASEGSGLWKDVGEKTYSFYDVVPAYKNKVLMEKKLKKELTVEEEIKIQKSKIQNTLEFYFSGPEDPSNEAKSHEKPILSEHFTIISNKIERSARFIAIPLIQFSEIDGFVYVIYQDRDDYLYDEENIKDLITGFSIEYEGVILAWDLAEPEYERSYAIRKLIEKICEDDNADYFKDKNPIFEEMGFPAYYRNHRKYFEDRFEQHDEMLGNWYDQLILYGSTAILLDSFAHNISAHALTTLTWIFKNRTKFRIRNEQYALVSQKMNDAVKTAVERKDWYLVKDTIRENIETRFAPMEEDDKTNYADLIHFDGSLMREIAPFLKFLQEKGGFWSGVTRDVNIGGQVNTLYSILFYDFVYNALYLGTIAESENIRKLHIDITVYEENLTNVLQDTTFIKKLPKGKAQRFATIDLGGKSIEHYHDFSGKSGKSLDGGDWYIKLPNGEKIWYEQLQGLEGLSRFVQLGNDFLDLEKKLRKVKLFFPGSIVGKHALFTMIENELRNIKHYFGKSAESINKRDEMILNISLQPASLGQDDTTEMYRVGLWLGFASPLKDEKIEDAKHQYLVKRRFDMLWDEILYENSRQPRLGGNSQDKVCAAMLFNNSFSSVQYGSFRALALSRGKTGNTRRDAIFYPWITPAVCFSNCDMELRVPAAAANFEIVYDKFSGGVDYKKRVDEFKNQIIEVCDKYHQDFQGDSGGLGVLKKYIYLWKGESIRTQQAQDEIEFDHLGRFKFIVATKGSNLWEKARDNGVIRIIEHLNNDNIYLEEKQAYRLAYNQWFRQFFPDPILIKILSDNKFDIAWFFYDPNAQKPEHILSFFSHSLREELDIKFKLNPPSIAEVNTKIKGRQITEITCAHNKSGLSSDVVRYRSHGVIYKHFMESIAPASNLSLDPVPAELLPELFEFLATRICLFDNRLFDRADHNRLSFYQSYLNLFFCPESRRVLKNGENSNEWGDEACKDQISKCHFLIIHLSFIDIFLKNKYGVGDSNIGYFIEKEIEPLVGKSDDSGLRDNFFLIVTTGRGRQNWRDFLIKEEHKQYHKYRKSVIFKPIESLIAALEDSLMLNDDFDLKYRLVKTLFGS